MTSALPESLSPTQEHKTALEWVDALVSDLGLRIALRPMKREITMQRLGFWRALELELEKCTDPAVEVMGLGDLRGIMDPQPVMRHRESVVYIDSLVLDLKLELLSLAPVNAVTELRLKEWQTVHRKDLERCKRSRFSGGGRR